MNMLFDKSKLLIICIKAFEKYIFRARIRPRFNYRWHIINQREIIITRNNKRNQLKIIGKPTEASAACSLQVKSQIFSKIGAEKIYRSDSQNVRVYKPSIWYALDAHFNGIKVNDIIYTQD